MRCQVGIGKTIVVDASLLNQATSKLGVTFWPGKSLAETRLLARRCPAWRRREPDLRLSHGTWEGVPRHRRPIGDEREPSKRRNRKELSTVAGCAGGPVRSSEEALVMRVERRGRIIRGCLFGQPNSFGRSRMNKLKSQDKPFDIPKWAVWEAYQRVKANKGAAGVDGQSIEDFEQDREKNLYRIWNRMSSGSYFPPPVRAVEIPQIWGGVRVLGVPTVADRIAQTVAAMYLERKVEPIFHQDSYGYRTNRSALDAVARCRERCWKN